MRVTGRILRLAAVPATLLMAMMASAGGGAVAAEHATARAAGGGIIVLAQSSPHKTAKAGKKRRATGRTNSYLGAAPGWATGIPVTGGLAHQSTSSGVPQLGGLSGPGALPMSPIQ